MAARPFSSLPWVPASVINLTACFLAGMDNDDQHYYGNLVTGHSTALASQQPAFLLPVKIKLQQSTTMLAMLPLIV